jgi:hypothetical protein
VRPGPGRADTLPGLWLVLDLDAQPPSAAAGHVAIGGRLVMIRLTVRRFFCTAPDCPVITFAE